MVSIWRSRGLCLWWGAYVHLKNTLAHRNLSVTGFFHETNVRRRSPFLEFSFNRFSYIVQTVHRSDHLFPNERLFGLDPRPARLQDDGGCRSSFGYCPFRAHEAPTFYPRNWIVPCKIHWIWRIFFFMYFAASKNTKCFYYNHSSVELWLDFIQTKFSLITYTEGYCEMFSFWLFCT